MTKNNKLKECMGPALALASTAVASHPCTEKLILAPGVRSNVVRPVSFHQFFLFFAIVFLSIIIGCSSSKKISSVAKSDVAKDGYLLVWSDEFNKDGAPDPASWSFENGFVRNHEDQWYQQQNAFCRNGLLEIEGRKEKKPNPNYQSTGNDWRTNRKEITYTSSSINTSGKHSWKYGRFIMRGKINIGDGLWPAWWTLGTEHNWPANGEIDIMEYYNGKLLANIACQGKDNKPEWFSNKFSADSLGGKKWSSTFHTWQMDWDQNKISLYLDQVLLNEVPLSHLVNKDGSGINPFNQPHYMLLNLAIGGDNGGNPASTIFPNQFEIDYVRVYQKK